MRVEDPMLSIVAMRLRLVSLSGARVSIAFQRPLNSSISAMSFRISGVMVMFFISCMIGYPFLSISTRFLPKGKPSGGRRGGKTATRTRKAPFDCSIWAGFRPGTLRKTSQTLRESVTIADKDGIIEQDNDEIVQIEKKPKLWARVKTTFKDHRHWVRDRRRQNLRGLR